jgi:diguanylate cyclase (GGDEF)-like protein
VLRVLVVGLGTTYAVSLLPGVRSGAGYVAALDGWVNSLFFTGVIALLLVRAKGDRRDRAAWLCFALGLACWLAGSLGYYLHYQYQEPIPYPSWADAGWVAFYPLAYVALFLMLRSRVSQPSRSMWLDGLVAGLTAAAYAVAFALGAALHLTDGSFAVVVTTFAYPVADVLLLLLVAGALTVIGRGAGPSWWWLSAGLACFGVTDTVYAYEVARGSYVDGGPLDLGWLLALACFALAACARRSNGTSTRLDGMGALVVPGLCALAALALLFHGFLGDGEPLAGALALGAVLAALARTGLTFAEVRALGESRRQARTDELTGLPNRRRVFEALADADQRLEGGAGVALLLLDLDRFKEVNDSLGHAAGDAVLRQVGPRLDRALREGDLLARLGGDEFIVLADGLDEDEAVQLAARLRMLLQQPFAVGAVELTIDATVGIAVGPRDSAAAEELLQLADLAMYSAKARRTGVAVFDDVRDGAGRHRLETVEQLRAGMDRGELVLHYQPKLDVGLDRVTGVEALVRWQHPQRGLLYPADFIDLAEAFGLMSQLTRHVLDGALLQCRTWADGGVQVTVAVNVSPSDLVDQHFPDHVDMHLKQHGLPSTALVLEVTESLLMEDRERAVSVLTRLRDSGVSIAIDDYGTGYSSLAYLAELPVSELKLDRSFIASMTGSRRSTAIVTSTLQLAHALGLAMVAEGVEDQATVDALTLLGCDVVQGYHLSRPLPPDQLAAWLQARTWSMHAPRRNPDALPSAV